MKKFILLVATNLFPLIAYSEYWGEFNMKKALVERLNVEANSRIRINSGTTALYAYRTEVGLVYQFSEFGQAGLYYENKQHWEPGNWKGTNSFGICGDLAYGLEKLSLTDRNRIDIEELGVFVYRNLLKIRSAPHKIYEKTGYYGQPPIVGNLFPCLEEEVFLNINETKVVENRLLLGICFGLDPYLIFKLGYMLYTQSERHTKGVILTTLEILFLEID